MFKNVYNLFLKLVVFFERLCCKYVKLGEIYYRLFYKDMIIREARLVDLKPNERILHIGGGNFPLTAIHLALKGYEIQVVDKSKQAVEDAKNVVKSWKLQDKIEIIEADGLNISSETFDVVWISLHVHPKDRIIKNLLKTLPPSGRIIYRNPRGLLKRLYPSVKPSNNAYSLVNQTLQKESVLILR